MLQLVDEKIFVGFLQEAADIEDQEGFVDLLHRVRDAYRLQHVSITFTGIDFSDSIVTAGTLPKSNMDTYNNSNAMKYSAILKKVRTGTPAVWSQIVPENELEKYIFENMESYFGHQGISIPLRSNDDNTSILVFCAYRDEKAWVRSLPVLVRDLRQIGMIVHRKLLKILGLTPPSIVLSERHLDVLQLLASGMNEEQIAHFLTISERSVKRYISEAKIRLRSRSKVQAVAAAISNGYLKI